MQDLIERLEKATGESRELDGEIWAIAEPAAFERQCSFKGLKYAGHVHTPAEKRAAIKRSATHFAPHFTASTDAALGLARTPEEAYQALAAARYSLARDHDLHMRDYTGNIQHDMARRLCIQFLRARAAMKTAQALAASGSG